MTAADPIILVIDSVEERVVGLREIIDITAYPQVRFARPDNWRTQVKDDRLAAVFVAEAGNRQDVNELLCEIAEYDPTVPVVVARR